MATSRSGRSRRSGLAGDDGHAALVERTFRAAHGRLIAALTRRFGVARLPLVENALQEACIRALDRPPSDTAEFEGWMLRVAYNAAIDEVRRERRSESLPPQIDAPEPVVVPELDDELCLMFLSCHPVLTRAAQIASRCA
jgi:RNA polymerase sigma-70 factor (ECF subfamily)